MLHYIYLEPCMPLLMSMLLTSILNTYSSYNTTVTHNYSVAWQDGAKPNPCRCLQ